MAFNNILKYIRANDIFTRACRSWSALLLFEYLEIFGTAVTRTISVRTIGRVVAARTLCNISIAQRTFINQIPLFWKGNVFLAKKGKFCEYRSGC